MKTNEPHREMNLPNDILFSILCILPVKSLLRFTCVCKSWNSLISSSPFIAAHYHHHHHQVNSNENDRYSYLINMPNILRQSSQVCTILRKSNAPPPSYVQHRDLLLPMIGGYFFLGVCEGLICLASISDDIYIWNPMLTTLKLVPPSETVPPDPTDDNGLIFGFGFANDDYRIVKIIYHEWGLHEVEMYSLGTNSWRRIECKPVMWRIYHWYKGVFFEGSIYWLANFNSEHNFILRFDLEEEIFEEMAAPPLILSSAERDLVVSNGFLVLVEARGGGVTGHVWVKKESSWIFIEEFEIPEDKNLLFIRVSKNDHLAFATRDDGARPRAAIKVKRVHAYGNYKGISGWKLGEMELSWTPTFGFVKVRETLFLLNEQDKNNGYDLLGPNRKVSTS